MNRLNEIRTLLANDIKKQLLQMTSLYENNINWADIAKKLNVEESKCKEMYIVAQDDDWTDEQVKELISLQKEATTMSHKQFMQLFNEKCKSKHTKAGIVQMIQFLQEENQIIEKGVQWTEEQVNVLKEIYKQKINFKQVVQRFQKQYP